MDILFSSSKANFWRLSTPEDHLKPESRIKKDSYLINFNFNCKIGKSNAPTGKKMEGEVIQISKVDNILVSAPIRLDKMPSRNAPSFFPILNWTS